LGAVGEGLLRSGVGEEAGDELVGELAEGEVDLGLEEGEGRGVARQLLGPAGLLVGELSVDLLQGLGGGWDIGAGLRVAAEAHGKSFRVDPELLVESRPAGGRRRPFLGMDPSMRSMSWTTSRR
jgi:hypothetical protein